VLLGLFLMMKLVKIQNSNISGGYRCPKAKRKNLHFERRKKPSRQGTGTEKILSPFERLHGRESYNGTGMGLTCRKIAERHKGGITATSKPGEGSVFIVTLPYKQLNG